MDLKEQQKIDPVSRHADKQSDTPEYSPMDPPDAYAPPGMEEVPYEAMPPFLQGLMDEHKTIQIALESFEGVLGQLQENGLKPDKGVDEGLRSFFNLLDDQIVSHHQKEEKILFPVLHLRLIEKGEHSSGGESPITAVDMMEDDHVKLMQIAAVTFNYLGLAARLPDVRSRAIVLDAALEQGKALVELLRLHMFREDSVVFPLAVKHLSRSELNEMG
jgi:hemerythrin-like domain-containing protein